MSTAETTRATAPGGDVARDDSARDTPGRDAAPFAAGASAADPAGREGAVRAARAGAAGVRRDGRDAGPRAVPGDGRPEPAAAAIGAGGAPGSRAARRATAGRSAEAPGGAGRGGGARGFARLLGSELRLVFRRPRNLAALGVLAVVPVLLGVAVRIAGAGEGEGPAIVAQIAGNGLVLTFAAMFLLVPLLLPIAVAVIAGDAIAGEASSGTLRYLLTAPAGRTRLLAVKYASVVVFCLAASLVVALSGLVTGLLMFPSGPMTLLSGVTIPFAEGLLRVLIVVGYVAAGMAALGAIGLAISTFAEALIAAIAATAGLVVVAQVLQAIPQLAVIRPYLVTSYWNDFDGALREPIATAEMQTGLLVFAAYLVVFGSIAWARFTGRDVSC